MRSPRQVTFVVSEAHLDLGSTAKRSSQLSAILGKHYGSHYSCQIHPLPKTQLAKARWVMGLPRGSIAFFTKMTVGMVGERLLGLLRRRGVRTCLDYVDSDLRLSRQLTPDIHVAASFAAESALREALSEAGSASHVALLHPAIDDLLLDVELPARPSFSAAYFGLAGNMFCTPEIQNRVAVHDIARTEDMKAMAPFFGNYALHYCVRAENRGGPVLAKPFSKGFVASHCGCPVLVDEHEADAIHILGPDYPFIVRGPDERAVLQGLSFAKNAFGGPVWADAIDRMQAAKALCDHRAVARQFHEMALQL